MLSSDHAKEPSMKYLKSYLSCLTLLALLSAENASA